MRCWTSWSTGALPQTISASPLGTTTSGANMIKKAWAVWKGSIKEGGGTISTETGVLNEAPYGFKSRFENGKGTNPEELIGAAHAGCFSMALSLMLGEAGLTAGKNRDACGRDAGKGRCRLRDHLEPPYRHGANSRCRRREVPGAREQGQGGLSGIEIAEGANHDGRQARDVNGGNVTVGLGSPANRRRTAMHVHSKAYPNPKEMICPD